MYQKLFYKWKIVGTTIDHIITIPVSYDDSGVQNDFRLVEGVSTKS